MIAAVNYRIICTKLYGASNGKLSSVPRCVVLEMGEGEKKNDRDGRKTCERNELIK